MSKLKKLWAKNWGPLHETAFFGTKINYVLSKNSEVTSATAEALKLLHSIAQGEFFVHLEELGGYPGVANNPNKDVELSIGVQGDFHEWVYKLAFRESNGVFSFEESIQRDGETICRNSGERTADKLLLLESCESKSLSELQECFTSISIHSPQDLQHWQELVSFLENEDGEEFLHLCDSLLSYLLPGVVEGSTEQLIINQDKLNKQLMSFLGLVYKIYLGRRIIIAQNPQEFMPENMTAQLPFLFEFIEERSGRKNQVFIFSRPELFQKDNPKPQETFLII